MSNDRKERGLEVLALSLYLDLDVEEPPEDLREKILTKINRKPNTLHRLVSKCRKHKWSKVAAIVMGLYGYSQYQNHQLQNQLKEQTKQM